MLLRRRVIVMAVIILGGACSSHRGAASLRPPATDLALRAELLRRDSADQEVRGEFTAAFRTGKRPDSALVARVWRVDAENTAWLRDVVARRGWLGRSMVGADGADAAFVLTQHADADTAFQARVLPLLAQAYRTGEATGAVARAAHGPRRHGAWPSSGVRHASRSRRRPRSAEADS